MKIDNLNIGINYKPLIIAEMSGNHNQSLMHALELLKIAYNCGVKIIKLQTYRANTITINSSSKNFIIKDKNSPWNGKKLFDLYEKAHTPWEWHEEIITKAKELDMICFSSVFDESSVDFLEKLKTPAFKISSFEINHIPLIEKVAKTKKPVILSSGMANLKDIKLAIKTLKSNGNNNYAILKCTSTYPADPKNSNLLTIPKYKKIFKCEVGLSDHTLGIGTSLASIGFGATIIEKHFTSSRNNGSVDSAFSLEPNELTALVKESEQAWRSIGKVFYGPTENEKKSLKFRRSIYIIKDMKKGEKFSNKNVKVIRPSQGLHPKYFKEVIGKKIKKNVKYGTPLKNAHFK